MGASEVRNGTQKTSHAKPQTEAQKRTRREKTSIRARGKGVSSFAEEKTALTENQWDWGKKKNQRVVTKECSIEAKLQWVHPISFRVPKYLEYEQKFTAKE